MTHFLNIVLPFGSSVLMRQKNIYLGDLEKILEKCKV